MCNADPVTLHRCRRRRRLGDRTVNNTGRNATSMSTLHGISRGRPRRRTSAAVTYLHVDVDPRVGQEIAAERDRSALAGDGLPDESRHRPLSSTAVGGFWGLASGAPTLIPLRQRCRYRRWRPKSPADAAAGASKCQNIDQIARLPGAVDWPDAKKEARVVRPAMAQVDVTRRNRTRSYTVGCSPRPVLHLLSDRPGNARRGARAHPPGLRRELRNRDASAAQIAPASSAGRDRGNRSVGRAHGGAAAQRARPVQARVLRAVGGRCRDG